MTIKVDEHGLTVQAARPALCYNIAVGAANVQSPAFQTKNPTPFFADGTVNVVNQNTNHIRVVASAACWIAFGAAPVAAVGNAASILIPANVPEYFWVYPGERLGAIQDSVSGTLNVAELVS